MRIFILLFFMVTTAAHAETTPDGSAIHLNVTRTIVPEKETTLELGTAASEDSTATVSCKLLFVASNSRRELKGSLIISNIEVTPNNDSTNPGQGAYEYKGSARLNGVARSDLRLVCLKRSENGPVYEPLSLGDFRSYLTRPAATLESETINDDRNDDRIVTGFVVPPKLEPF